MGKQGVLLFVDLSHDANRLGGSALAQCYNQLGSDVPDLRCVKDLRNAFAATQELIKDGAVLAGHDVSDGGLISEFLAYFTLSYFKLFYAFSNPLGNVLCRFKRYEC